MNRYQLADKLRELYSNMKNAAENNKFVDALAIKSQIGDLAIEHISLICYSLEDEE